ncbi:hypothetical protein BpHYR1_011646 [Brachionus plicatilis]|uniref:Uncharacterized protein n=1 Tax=Brachionus plicatilis TaxID=10195 RepID=A0A3M7PCK0_BRAPC|nr:hypothetical protein BpHYR1_011646 [Brachionus plicatilis]
MIGISPTNRSVSFNPACVPHPCSNMTKPTVRIVPQPPQFRLAPPPNPLNFLSPNSVLAQYDLKEYSKEKFLLYFLSYQDDSAEKCESLRIQLLANEPFVINKIEPRTGTEAIKISNKIEFSHRSPNFSLNSTEIVHSTTKTLHQNPLINQSSSFFTFFNVILFTITIFLLIGLILLVIYLILLKRKSKLKKKKALSSESTFLSSNSATHANFKPDQNLVLADLNNQSLNEQYQHLLDTSQTYMNDTGQFIPANFNENLLFKKNQNCSTPSSASSTSNQKSTFTTTTNSMPLNSNYNSFRHSNKPKKNETLNRKCSCVSSVSSSSNCSNSSSVLLNPCKNQQEPYMTLMKQKNEFTSPRHANHNEFCINPYQQILMDFGQTGTMSPCNFLDTNTLNKVALICSHDQQFNTAKLVKIVNLPNYCTNCVHHATTMNGCGYVETDQHYVNNYSDDKLESEQVYEIIDGENENEDAKSCNKSSLKSDLSSIRKKYPRTNPNFLLPNRS